MRGKKDAQKYLARLEMIDSIIPCKLIEKQQWHDLAVGLSGGGQSVVIEKIVNDKRIKELHNLEKVQSSRRPSKMADAIAKCIDMEAEIDRAVERLKAEKKEIISTLEQLDNPTEYRLLHARYIQYIELKDIAAQWGMEYTNITTTHGRAIDHVQEILDRRMKDA